ncbi:hypothetical protein R5W24_005756 [Gemmata sp. JC717]|uniref:hypothetical protein n=1 Tax=Gemmata algarum TaxID=2975278 RepID=UPI0021BB63F8|nr:hypothetical protein [Gemmata algarum]MDY3556589.1 hypothetical protein [Gemmata algarum]
MQTNHTPPPGQSLRHRRRAGVRWFACTLLAAHCAIGAGCRSTNNRYDLIEAELRTRERELADTRAALEQSRNLLRAYETAQRPEPPPGTPVNGRGGPFYPVKQIDIARGTGGIDEDGAPGDEGLMVVIVPRDEDGSAIKVPARVLVAAWEISPAGLKSPIGSWEISAEKLRGTWKSGLISTGYFVAVPWQTLPSSDRVRVAVRLTTADGRAFEADRDITVRVTVPPRGPGGAVLPYPQPAPGGPAVPRMTVPPGGSRAPLLPESPPPGVPPAVPAGTEELPPPMPSNGERGARLLPPVRP